MKAVVSTGAKREVVVRDIPKPLVQPGTLLLKTKYCSICGTDLEYLDNSLSYLSAGSELHAGAILGHEFSAEVAEVGEGVKGWTIGDRVAVGETRQSCGQCYFCRRRLPHLCLGVTGIRSLFTRAYGDKSGAMAEYFVRASTAVQKIPDNVSDEEAVLVEPLSNGMSAVRAAEIRPGDSAVVIGAGKIGLGAMLCARAAGATPLIVIDVIKSRLEKALEMGADAVINAKEVDVIPEVLRLTEAGPDAVLICVRHGAVLNQSIDMVRRGGAIVLVGFMPPTEITPDLLVWKNLKLTGVFGASPLITPMNLIARKQVNVKPLISAIIPMDEAQRAFDSMYSGENIVALLKP
jgi:threonine dehydrogenase-like Zn-dependent dehydrogenase